MRRSLLEKTYFKKEQIRLLEPTKSKKIIAVDFIRNKRLNQCAKSIFFTDNKLFWKTVKPFLSEKGNYEANIELIEKEDVLQDDSEIVEKLNEFFKHAVSTLDVTENSFIINEKYKHISDPVIELLKNSNLIQVFL